MKPLHVELDDHAHEKLLRARHAIVERNKERAISGEIRLFEGTTFKDIIQRGIGLVVAEVIPTEPNDVI